MEEHKRIRTMEAFAAVAGISRPTVSKYFNDPESVRASTRKRIEKALEQYDYRPNIFAINQNRQSTKNIGIVVPYLSDPFFAEIARKLERECLAAGYWPIVFSSHGQREIENDNLDSLRGLKPAGALLAPLGKFSDRSVLEAFCADVPTVLFDSEFPGIGEAFFGSDNHQSIGMLVDYLCETGEPPCFFEMPPVNPNATKRRRAYRAAMQRHGCAPDIVHVDGVGWDFEEVGYIEGQAVLAERRLSTNTVLCSNDRLAIGFLTAAYEKGLRVGRGSGYALRIAGHDDHPFSRYTCPPLTTVTQDYAAITTSSAAALFDLIRSDGRVEARENVLFPGHLVKRMSA